LILSKESISRRELIETAAREEFARLGFHGARVERIARTAGVNKQLIYYYFGSKRSLYEHALREATESLRGAPSERRQMPGSPAERLRRLLDKSMERVAANPEILRAALLPGDDDANKSRQALGELADEFAREVSRGQGLGYFRDDADPGMLGLQAAALVLGWAAIAADPRRNDRRPDRATWAVEAADLLGRSLAW
jgi:TetR/AcrR family transcriptional regulator